MSLTDSLQADIAAFEKFIGHSVKDEDLQLIRKITEKGDCFAQKGLQHATEGRKPWTAEDFAQWGREQFGRKDVEEIASLMHQCYLEGYKAGREAAV